MFPRIHDAFETSYCIASSHAYQGRPRISNGAHGRSSSFEIWPTLLSFSFAFRSCDSMSAISRDFKERQARDNAPLIPEHHDGYRERIAELRPLRDADGKIRLDQRGQEIWWLPGTTADRYAAVSVSRVLPPTRAETCRDADPDSADPRLSKPLVRALRSRSQRIPRPTLRL